MASVFTEPTERPGRQLRDAADVPALPVLPESAIAPSSPMA